MAVLLFCIYCACGHAQKRIEQKIPWGNLNAIKIDADSIFSVHIETRSMDHLDVRVKAEGEHSEHVALKTEVVKDVLELSVGLQPIFNVSDDKLNAHKAISIELFIIMPESRQLQVSSDIASVNLKGMYENVIVELRNGPCVLDEFSGTAVVNTIGGDIDVFSKLDFKIDAMTKHGELHLNSNSRSKYGLSLNSIYGDITVNKSQ